MDGTAEDAITPAVILSEQSESKDLFCLEEQICMYFVYILSNWNDSVLYIGVTNNLPRRLYEHRNHLVPGFSSKYNTHKLVYFEETNDVYSAISREKQLKGWVRKKKNDLIIQKNPEWRDLSAEWT